MIKIGFPVPEASDDEIRQLEKMGADSLWSTGHLWMDGPCPEAITALARIGFLTESVEVGTSVLVLPIYPPMIVAKMIAELDRMLGGRVLLGIGVGGEYEPEFESTGVPVSERGARTDESVDILKRLWGGGRVDFEAKYGGMHLKDFELAPLPARVGGPPIIVGGRAPQAMRRAARTDGWQPMNYTPKRYAASVDTIREHAETLGRDLDGFFWGIGGFVIITGDVKKAREDALAWMASRAHPMDPAVFERISIAGDVDAVAERMAEFVDAGVRHFSVSPAIPAELLSCAEALIGDVLPQLQRHLGSKPL